MADTQRTESACLALLPLTGARRRILVQGVRDIVYSLYRYVDSRTGGSAAEYGEIYWSTPAATTLTQNVWAKAAGTTTISIANDFTMPANNRLQHDDTETEVYLVSCDFTITAGANNQTVWVGISKGGATPIVALRRYRLIATGADGGMGAVAGLVSLAAGEYVELWVMNATSSNTVTVQAGSLRAVKSV